MCLGNPAVGVGPDGRAVFADGQVEALVGKGQLFGIALQRFKAEVVFGLQAATGELVGGVVDGGDGGAESDHLRREVACAAA